MVLAFSRDQIKGRLGDVDAAGADQLLHVAEEEGQQQSSDVAAVDVGVGHDDDFAVAAFFQIEFLADAAAQGADDGADFLVAEHFDEVGFFHVEDFALEGEDGLDVGIASALGGPAGGKTFDQKEFGVFVALGAAIGEFAGQAGAFQGIFAAGQFAGLTGGFAGFGGHHPLLEDQLGRLGILLKIAAEFFVDGRENEGFNVRVEQFVLGLAFKLRLGELDGDDGDESFAHVVAGGADVLHHPRGFGIAVYGSRRAPF